MNRKTVQAKNILDSQIVSVVSILHPNANRLKIIECFPMFPAKIVTAKLRQATLKGLLTGCASDVCARNGRGGCSEAYRVAVIAS